MKTSPGRPNSSAERLFTNRLLIILTRDSGLLNFKYGRPDSLFWCYAVNSQLFVISMTVSKSFREKLTTGARSTIDIVLLKRTEEKLEQHQSNRPSINQKS